MIVQCTISNNEDIEEGKMYYADSLKNGYIFVYIYGRTKNDMGLAYDTKLSEEESLEKCSAYFKFIAW